MSVISYLICYFSICLLSFCEYLANHFAFNDDVIGNNNRTHEMYIKRSSEWTLHSCLNGVQLLQFPEFFLASLLIYKDMGFHLDQTRSAFAIIYLSRLQCYLLILLNYDYFLAPS